MVMRDSSPTPCSLRSAQLCSNAVERASPPQLVATVRTAERWQRGSRHESRRDRGPRHRGGPGAAGPGRLLGRAAAPGGRGRRAARPGRLLRAGPAPPRAAGGRRDPARAGRLAAHPGRPPAPAAGAGGGAGRLGAARRRPARPAGGRRRRAGAAAGRAGGRAGGLPPARARGPRRPADRGDRDLPGGGADRLGRGGLAGRLPGLGGGRDLAGFGHPELPERGRRRAGAGRPGRAGPPGRSAEVVSAGGRGHRPAGRGGGDHEPGRRPGGPGRPGAVDAGRRPAAPAAGRGRSRRRAGPGGGRGGRRAGGRRQVQDGRQARDGARRRGRPAARRPRRRGRPWRWRGLPEGCRVQGDPGIARSGRRAASRGPGGGGLPARRRRTRSHTTPMGGARWWCPLLHLCPQRVRPGRGRPRPGRRGAAGGPAGRVGQAAVACARHRRRAMGRCRCGGLRVRRPQRLRLRLAPAGGGAHRDAAGRRGPAGAPWRRCPYSVPHPPEEGNLMRTGYRTKLVFTAVAVLLAAGSFALFAPSGPAVPSHPEGCSWTSRSSRRRWSRGGPRGTSRWRSPAAAPALRRSSSASPRRPGPVSLGARASRPSAAPDRVSRSSCASWRVQVRPSSKASRSSAPRSSPAAQESAAARPTPRRSSCVAEPGPGRPGSAAGPGRPGTLTRGRGSADGPSAWLAWCMARDACGRGLMDVPAERSVPTAGPQYHPAVREAAGPRRRRPSGEPPPLPHHLQTSGVRWLVATLVLMVLAIGVFAGGLNGFAVGVAVFDAAVVGWLGGVDLPGFEAVMRGLAAISSWWVLNGVSYGLIVVLLVLRRFRHLIIWLVLVNLLVNIGGAILGPVTQRPRPFGAEIREGWGGWAMPSLHVTFLAVGLVTILYTLVPEGRWRNTGKWVVTALVTLTAIGRMALGADGPSDVLVGAALGVTIPLLAYRWFAPNEVFPISYRGGSGAHLDVGGARGQAIRRGLEDQLGLEVTEVKPFGLAGSAGPTPLRITVKGDPPTYLFGKLYARSHLRSDRWYKLGRELLYGRLEDEKPFNTVRRLVQQEDYALSLMQRAGLPSPTPYGFVELTPERE